MAACVSIIIAGGSFPTTVSAGMARRSHLIRSRQYQGRYRRPLTTAGTFQSNNGAMARRLQNRYNDPMGDAYGTMAVKHLILPNRTDNALNCCLNNYILMVQADIHSACLVAAEMGNAAVLLPPMLEEDGQLVRSSPPPGDTRIFVDVYNASAIEKLKAVGRDINCVILSDEEARALHPGAERLSTNDLLGARTEKFNRRERATSDGVSTGIRHVYRGFNFDDAHFTCWAYEQTQVPASAMPAVSTCVEEAAEAFGTPVDAEAVRDDPLGVLRSLDFVAVHARIEVDWVRQRRCFGPGRTIIGKGNRGIHWCYGPQEIAERILDDPVLKNKKNFMFFHGEAHWGYNTVLGNATPSTFWSTVLPGKRIFHKSGGQCERLLAETPELSKMLADLMMAKEGRHFVGHWGSTFTVGLLRARRCQGSEGAAGSRAYGRTSAAAGLSATSSPPKLFIYSCPKGGARKLPKDVRLVGGDCSETEGFGVGFGGV